MSAAWFNHEEHAGAMVAPSTVCGDAMIASCLAAAELGDVCAYFDLGVAFSTAGQGTPCDLVEAHKWFNLAAVGGHDDAHWCRADVAEEMTTREIAEAQRRARQWLASTGRRAA